LQEDLTTKIFLWQDLILIFDKGLFLAYRFAIIGGGLTATSMLCQVVDRLAAMGDSGRPLCEALTIVVYEKENQIGPGLPHSEQNVLPLHITNMCAQEMSVRADKPGEFFHWLIENIDTAKQLSTDLYRAVSETDRSRQCCHYPRALMGEYLKSQFKEAVHSAENLGVSVELYPACEVTDLYQEAGCHHLIVEKSAGQPPTIRHHADAVLLATGHWFEESKGQTYYSSPWPAAMLLDTIPKSADVAILGSSLSAIETALTLSSDGKFLRSSAGTLSFLPADTSRKLTLYSRRGLLPRVRGRRVNRRNIFLTCEKLRDLIKSHPFSLNISLIFDLFKREMAAAYSQAVDWQKAVQPFDDVQQLLRHDITIARNGDGHNDQCIWQTILAEVVPMARELYLNFSSSERKHFDEKYTTLFFMHVATQPLENAEKLLALMDAGVVAVVSLGDDYQFEYDKDTSEYLIEYRGANGKKQYNRCKYVVNATGQSRSILSDPAPLTQNLIKRLQQQSGQNGDRRHSRNRDKTQVDLIIDPKSHQVMMPVTGLNIFSVPPLFAVGPMVRNQIIDTSMAHGLSKSTAQVVERLLTILGEQVNS
jgi:uncharacterized NAD(P)/FAD-binding protein YdhS